MVPGGLVYAHVCIIRGGSDASRRWGVAECGRQMKSGLSGGLCSIRTGPIVGSQRAKATRELLLLDPIRDDRAVPIAERTDFHSGPDLRIAADLSAAVDLERLSRHDPVAAGGFERALDRHIVGTRGLGRA